MGITIHESIKQFHLYNSKISYVLGVLRDGTIGHFYYGSRIHEDEVVEEVRPKGCRPLCCGPSFDEEYSKETTLFEYPSFGSGDFRSPSIEVLQENGAYLTDLRYVGHRVIQGKQGIPGLPSAYVQDDWQARTLEIDCVDEVAGLAVTLSYTIWEEYPTICRHATMKNIGEGVLRLNETMSVCLDLPDQNYTWLQFEGAWARERYPRERDLSSGITQIESVRGHSSANYNPFVILKRPRTDEERGEAIGVHLAYSGNFIARSQADPYGGLRFTMGIHPRWFSWELQKGESFETPEAILTYTKTGLNDLSQNIARFLNNQMVKSPYQNKPRPILLNNWEATEMDFTEEKILNIARKGKEAGVELFVLDDGWFGKRNNDYAGLGDWFANIEKLPEGLGGLSRKINDLGLQFGFWIEAEMVNEDSDLYRAHPDWVLAVPGRDRSLGRHQMVLDYSKQEVVDNIYNQLADVISNANIAYIKWDMNRSITECFSQGAPASKEGMTYHKYILGVYSLYERLTKAFPEILFESCASGGGRFDAGILQYAPQAWCSDDTDGHERVKIQFGTSYGYPVVSMGAHVSASPNQQTGRKMSIGARANIACFGTFGYELDLNEISEEDFREVTRQIAFMKEYRGVFQYGDLYRLQTPFDHNTAAWMVVSKDKKTAILATYKSLKTPNTGNEWIPLQGLDPDLVYTVTRVEQNSGANPGENARKSYGDHLMSIGIPTIGNGEEWFRSDEDFSSRMYVLKAD